MRRQVEERGMFAVPEVWYRQPIYYKGNRFSCSGHGDDIPWPAFASLLDFELEFGAWIGKPGKDIAREDAREHIFGYSVFDDFTARDAQLAEMPGQLGPAKSKDFDGANAIGPCIVTADAIDPYALAMIVRVNGEELSRGSSSTMHWRFEDVIAHASASETLHPGEFLGSGTVGNGCGLELGRFLEPGDVVELEVEGIGVLRNRLVK
jgi:2-keto-4-pentenoate hydratase/2-oxohepta-3-ene-1,7-dioic acid hydratase in catechol pathway